MTIIKKDLVDKVAEATNLTKREAGSVVNALFESMRNKIIDNNRIEVRGFGVFEVKRAAAKPAARNPRTGEKVYVPVHRKTHFRPGKALKKELKKPLS